MDRYNDYLRWKSRTEARKIRCALSFKQWWDIWEKSGAYKARGSNGWVMAQSVIGDGFVPGNVEIIPAAEVFRRSMDTYYSGERSYL